MRKTKPDNGKKLQVLEFIANNPHCNQPDIVKKFGFGLCSARGYIDKLLYSEDIERSGVTFDHATYHVPKILKIKLTARTGGDFSYVYANKPVVGQEFRMNR